MVKLIKEKYLLIINSNTKLPKMMIEMFILQPAPLFCTHLTKRRMRSCNNFIRISCNKFPDQRLELLFFKKKIRRIFYNKVRNCGQILFHRFRFQHLLLCYFSKQNTE